jgi:hypothetical protein
MRRYRKYLELPEWTPEDILELGDNMQREVVHGLAIKRSIERRLRH